ncbi:uncharacterized protein LOC142338107 [Convolutriloba macropyga]|uniref:uncharacterized protein LOC142338107 n=1 Tax=Convolutriloba macropyga TaxID=536237 RepID=UPI003F5285F7
MARVQWHALQKRLERDNQLKQRYMTTIFDDMDKGYIASVTNQDAKNVWYLPHHPVINKQKPDKVRRVTNAASKYKGVSLNDALLTGPDLLCNLHGLLLWFQEEAANTATELKHVLKTGGFNLTKFLIKIPAVLEKIPEEDRTGVLKLQRIIGQTWNPQSDHILFAKPKLSYEKENITQRKLLSMTASLFDPIGIISPFAIRLRCIFQKVIKQGHNWDQLLSEEYYHEIQQWMEDFQNMLSIQIPRCLVPNVDGTHELHTFTDASLSAVSAVRIRIVIVPIEATNHYPMFTKLTAWGSVDDCKCKFGQI